MKDAIRLAFLAFRNIARHPLKNILVAIMIFLATFLSLFTASISENTRTAWRDFISETFVGDYNVTAFKGLEKDYTIAAFKFPARTIAPEIVSYLEKNKVPFSRRIKLGGMCYDDVKKEFKGKTTFTIVGGQWETESKQLTNLKVVSGGYDPKVANGVLVWKELMATNKWKLGDEITFFIKDIDGQNLPFSFIITGVVFNGWGDSMEGKADVPMFPFVMAKYGYLSEKLGVPPGEAVELAVWDKGRIHERQVRALAAKADHLVYNAEKAYEVIVGVIDFINFVGYFIIFFILIILAVATLNINLMAFFERRREIGSIIAIGAKPWWVIRLLASEMLIFSLLSFTISVAIYAVAAYAFHNGIDMGPMRISYCNRLFYPYVVPSALAMTFAVVMGTMALSSFYPLYLTTKLDPVQVFREGET